MDDENQFSAKIDIKNNNYDQKTLKIVIKSIKATISSNFDTFGQMEPYCILQIGDQIQKTVQTKGKYPFWDNEYTFFIKEYLINPTLKVQIWEKDITQDDFIGQNCIELYDFIQNQAISEEEVCIELLKKDNKEGIIQFQLVKEDILEKSDFIQKFEKEQDRSEHENIKNRESCQSNDQYKQRDENCILQQSKTKDMSQNQTHYSEEQKEINKIYYKKTSSEKEKQKELEEKEKEEHYYEGAFETEENPQKYEHNLQIQSEQMIYNEQKNEPNYENMSENSQQNIILNRKSSEKNALLQKKNSDKKPLNNSQINNSHIFENNYNIISQQQTKQNYKTQTSNIQNNENEKLSQNAQLCSNINSNTNKTLIQVTNHAKYWPKYQKRKQHQKTNNTNNLIIPEFQSASVLQQCSLVSYSIPKQRRFENIKDKKPTNEANYVLLPSIFDKNNKRGPSFSVAKRCSILNERQQGIPGPGMYNIDINSSNNIPIKTRNCSFGQKNIMKTPDNSPGPGDYNIGHELGKIKEIIPKHTDENTHNQAAKTKQSTKGDNNYLPHYKLVQQARYERVSFGQSRRDSVSKKSGPGPGDYNISSKFSRYQNNKSFGR